MFIFVYMLYIVSDLLKMSRKHYYVFSKQKMHANAPKNFAKLVLTPENHHISFRDLPIYTVYTV